MVISSRYRWQCMYLYIHGLRGLGAMIDGKKVCIPLDGQESCREHNSSLSCFLQFQRNVIQSDQGRPRQLEKGVWPTGTFVDFCW